MISPANNYDSRKGLIPICQVTETIDRPVEVVWSVVSAFGAIKTWMPGIEACHVLEDRPQPPAEGAVRAVSNLGMVIEETLEIWDLKEHFCSYRLMDPSPWPLRGCRGSVRLTAKRDDEGNYDGSKTEVTWRADAEEITDEAIAQVTPALVPFFRSGIGELRRILMRSRQEY